MAFQTKAAWYNQGTVATDGTANIVGTSTNFTDIGDVKVGDLFSLNGADIYQIISVGDGTTNGDSTAGTAAGTAAGNNTLLTLDRSIATGTSQSYVVLKLSSVNPINSDIAYRVSQMVQAWQQREDELIAWLAGTSSGGNLANGEYPLTDAIGNTSQVKSPAKMQSEADAVIATVAGAGMDGVMAANTNTGGTGNIPAGKSFTLNNAAGTRTLLNIDEQRGLAGMVGNINSPLTHLVFSGLELPPFASAQCSIAAPAAIAVAAPVFGLSEMFLTFASIPAGVVAEKCFATINGVDYPIRALSGDGVSIYIEYDDTLTDPTGTPAVIFSLWRFRGKYAGNHNYARASRKTYTDPLTGNLRMEPAGYPCFERMADGKIGVSLEGAGNNLAFNSETIGAVATCSTALNTTIDTPYGFSGSLISTVNTGSGRYGAVKLITGLTIGVTYTASIIAAHQVGFDRLSLFRDLAPFTGSTSSYTFSTDTIVGSELRVTHRFNDGSVRLEMTFVSVAANENIALVAFNTSVNDYTPTGVETMIVEAIQVEALPFASSYIPTAGAAVNRAADDLSISAKGNLNSSAFTCLGDFAPKGNGQYFFDMDVNTSGAGRVAILTNNNSINFFNLENYYPPINPYSTGYALHRVGFKTDFVQDIAFFDGAVVLSHASSSALNLVHEATDLFLGRRYSNSQYMYGHIGFFDIYDSLLTDQEMGAA